MNDTIIDNINEVVFPGDTLFHLGDFSFGKDRNKTNEAAKYLDRIKCKNVILIPGNHDPHYKNGMPRKEFADLFAGCFPFYRVKTEADDKKIEIFLFHYACRVWNKSHYGAWHLFGHSHGYLNVPETSLSYDVGVDSNGFRPLNVYDIQRKMETKTFKPINHHMSPDEYKEWALQHGH